MTGETAALLRFHEVMRGLHAREDLHQLLQEIARGVTEVAGFEHALINMMRDDGLLEVVVVEGPPDLREAMMGAIASRHDFESDFHDAEEWGLLRFLPHDRFRAWDHATYVPDFEVRTDVDDAWHPLDVLYAPLEDAHGELLGILSVDLPTGLRRPGEFQRKLLEMFAVQAGLALSRARHRRLMDERVRLGEMQRRVMRQAGHLDIARLGRNSLRSLATGLGVSLATVKIFATDEAAAFASTVPDSITPTPGVVEAASELAGRAWEGHRVVVVRRTDDGHGVLRAAMEGRGIESVMIAPIGVGDAWLGLVMAGRGPQEPTWSRAEMEHTLDVGRDLGRAVLNARVFEREQHLVEQLRELDDYKQRLITTISHELKGPLSSIQGHLELLEPFADDPSLLAIERSSRRLGRLAEDFLLLLKLDRTTAADLSVAVDLGGVAAEAVELLEAQARLAEVTVHGPVSTESVRTRGDAQELGHVAANLVSNAVKFTPAGGTVTVECGRTDDEVWLRVSDSGLGISEHDQAKLFREFYRSDNPDALKVGGTGLGLSIVKRIVTRHGGRVELSSDLGAGTSVTVTLPGHDEGGCVVSAAPEDRIS